MNTSQDQGSDRLEQNAASSGAPGGNQSQGSLGNQGHEEAAANTDHAIGDTARELKQTVGNLASEAGAEGKARVDDYREVAAARVSRIAQSVKAAASELEADDVGSMSRRIADLAGGMERLSKGLREKSGDELLRDVHGIARSNPGVFLAASVAVGFGLTRLLRASALGPEAGPEGGTSGGDSSPAGASSGHASAGNALASGQESERVDPFATVSGETSSQAPSYNQGAATSPAGQQAAAPAYSPASSQRDGGFAGGTGAETRGETISVGSVEAESGQGFGRNTDARAEGASGTYGAAGTFAAADTGGFNDAAESGGVAKPGAAEALDDGTGFATGDESNGRKPL